MANICESALKVVTRNGVNQPASHKDWITILELVADDILAFEVQHGPLKNAVPRSSYISSMVACTTWLWVHVRRTAEGLRHVRPLRSLASFTLAR